jgi:hypothetical protein
MSRRRPTVPVTTGVCPPDFSIKNWPGIEEACKFKSKLPAEVIEVATRRFLSLQKMEAEAIPLADQKRDLLKIATTTEMLRFQLSPLKNAVSVSIPGDEEIEKGPDREQIKKDVDRGFQIMHRLEPYFDEVISFRSDKLGERRPFRNFAQEMEVLCSLLASLEHAATEAAGKTRDEKDLQLKGDAWDRWIAEIYQILTDHGLSATTSNDTDKRPFATETPFLRLVKELQNLLPKEARRRVHSNPALAKAIQRAIERVSRLSQERAA